MNNQSTGCAQLPVLSHTSHRVANAFLYTFPSKSFQFYGRVSAFQLGQFFK